MKMMQRFAVTILAALLCSGALADLIIVNGQVLRVNGSVFSPSAVTPSGNADVTLLPTISSPNETAYTALNVRAMAAGTVFSDPSTSTRVVKLTASGSPSSAQFYPQYSTMGLSISQPWGAGGDQYTIALLGSAGTNYLVDYQIGGTISNVRSFPGNEARFSFARSAGNERVIYIATGTQLRRYNTQTNTYQDTGLFPYTWNATSWLQFNADDSYATGMPAAGSTITALRLSDGTVLSHGSQTSLDEIYSGYGNVALVNRGETSSQLWNLDTDSFTGYSRPNSNFGPSHAPALRGFWMLGDSNTGGGFIRWARTYPDNTSGSSMSQACGYWNQWHSSGFWWNQTAGNSQWFMTSYWQNGVTANLEYGLVYINSGNASCRFLGYHYSQSPATTTDDYWSQPHATISVDGKITVYGSNMLDGPRIDAFLVETPRS